MDIGSIGSIVASGMQATRAKADAHADNIANARTPGHKRAVVRTTERSEGGVDLSVQRDPSPGNVQYAGGGVSQPPSADDGSSAGRAFDPGAEESSEATRGALNASSQSTEGSNVDLAEEMIGLEESARQMEMLAAVYERGDQALGTVIDAFG